ncbi:carbohydrate ABC transporter permease [Alkalispirochaeta americana]|nr:sugar ABC transporter permease [Alkalispirochaeta americana]
MNRGFVGFQNYVTIFESGHLQAALGATLYFALGTIVFQMVIGMIVALSLNVDFAGKNFVRSLILIPWAIPTSLVGIMWSRFLSSTDGYFNATLRLLGLVQGEMNWFLDRFLAITMVVLVDSWKFTPITVMIFLAGLQAIPRSMYEAALVDGANRWKQFLYVTLPVMKPVVLVALIMRTIFVFHAFDLIFILTKGGPGDSTRVLSYYAYQESFIFLRHGRGAAVAFILFLFTALITVGYVRMLREKKPA